MEKPTIVALIVTRSISLADGLEALLKAIPKIDEAETVRNFENALKQIEARKPGIILLDSVLLGKKPEASLEKIHTLSPETRRVLVVDSVQNVKWVPQYAEAILIKGISPAAVARIITSLLFSKGDLP